MKRALLGHRLQIFFSATATTRAGSLCFVLLVFFVLCHR
jgi:hypothetical protein